MKTLKYIISILVTTSVFASCVGDLNVTPIDPSLNTPDKALKTADDYFALLAGCYTGFATSGYKGPNDDPSISGLDGGQSQYFRGLYHLNGVSTDEVVCGWGDDGMPDMSKATWTADNTFVMSFYYRVFHQISLFNEFIRKVNTATIELPDAKRWIAEARTLRAMCWLHAIDNFGNVPFSTENSSVGSEAPKQIKRADLFAYIEEELTELLAGNDLYDYAQGEYGRANKGLAAMILAKLYLNAEVYLGTASGNYYQKCADVLAPLVGKYNLHTTSKGKYSAYQELFLADNHTCTEEVIFAIQQDGTYTKSWGVTQYLIFASVGGTMNSSETFGISSGWGGLRTTPQFFDLYTTDDDRFLFYTNDIQEADFTRLYNAEVEAYKEALEDYEEAVAGGDANAKEPEPVKPFDEWMKLKEKERHTKEIADMSTYANGYPPMKWRNVNSDGTPGQSSGFVDTDWPVYRYADALLMLAECELKGAAVSGGMTGKQAFDAVRARAGMSPIELTEQNLLDERGRELFQEGHRRSDLIRFGKYTSGYNWAWKGGNVIGQDLPAHFDLFPIPSSDKNANSNLEQNPGYGK